MLVIGPPLFVLSWPWLWHDTFARFREYVEFHRLHEYYNMEFLGRTYWKPPMPRLYAWVMTLATVPGITLLAFACGLVSSAHFALRHRNAGPESRLRFSTETLWLLGVLTSYAPWLSDQTPIFEVRKHWITAYPFLCICSQGAGSRSSSTRRRRSSGTVLGDSCSAERRSSPAASQGRW